MKHGAPHEIMTVYNMCKSFNKLPSEVENEDPVMMEALMTIDRAVESKQKNASAIESFKQKISGKNR